MLGEILPVGPKPIKGLVRPIEGNPHLLDNTGQTEAMRLLYVLQNALPKTWGKGDDNKNRRKKRWLDRWVPEVLRFIELKSIEQTADFLGLGPLLLEKWAEEHGVVVERSRSGWPKVW